MYNRASSLRFGISITINHKVLISDLDDLLKVTLETVIHAGGITWRVVRWVIGAGGVGSGGCK